MSAVPKTSETRLTPEEYLTRERRAEFKSEYFQGRMIAMSGASYAHVLIRDNLAFRLREVLQGGPCQVLTGDMRVKVSADGRYVYPDLVVVCDKPKFEDNVMDTLLNPLMLIEVLSDSTEKSDRGAKFHSYQAIESLREYVLVSQHRPVVERFVRREGGSWMLTPTVGLEATVRFESVPVSIPLAEIYERVEFPPPTPEDWALKP